MQAVTPKAILLAQLYVLCSRQQKWIPKSLIIESDTDLDDVREGDEIEIEIPRWLAEREGIEE